MTTALHPVRVHHRRRRVPLSALAQLIAGETTAMPPSCAAFAIHPDRTAVLVRYDGTTTTLHPGPDGLYALDHLMTPDVDNGTVGEQ